MSMGLPGTGIYMQNYLGKQKKGAGTAAAATSQQVPKASVHDFDLPPELKDNKSSAGCLLFVISVVALLIFWPVGVVLLASDIIWQIAGHHTPEDRARGLFFQGQHAVEHNDPAGALESFKKAAEIKPEMPLLWLKIADLEREQGDLADAEKAYEKAMEHGKNDPDVQYHLGWTLMNENKPEEAIKVLQALPPEVKQDIAVINAMAGCFLGMNQPQAALEVLEQGPTRKRTMDGQMVVFHYLTGAAYKELGNKKQAVAHLSKVIAADEGFLDAKELLGQVNKLNGGQ
jgi:tetratricopeptide (TPR) repeat protein